MTLIIILASVGMTQYRNSVTRAEEAVLKENLFRMRDAMDQFYADKNKWPADLCGTGVGGYIREVPEDLDHQVEGHLADRHRRARSRTIRHRPAASATCTADRIGRRLDGTRYSEWN